MDYKAPVAEQRFVLDHVAGIAELAAHDAFAAASSDMLDAIIDGAVRFAEGEYAPLNRSGDIQGAKWNGGAVTMHEGFRKTYQAFVATGCGATNGPEHIAGQGLRFPLCSEGCAELGRAKIGVSLV